MTDLVKEKQDQRAKEDANAFLKALKADGGIASLEKESAKFGLKVETTGFFKRNGSIGNIGYESEITKSAFLLSKKNRLPNEVIKGTKGYYVIRFKNRKQPPVVEFAKKKKDIAARLLQQKKYQTCQKRGPPG